MIICKLTKKMLKKLNLKENQIIDLFSPLANKIIKLIINEKERRRKNV